MLPPIAKLCETIMTGNNSDILMLPLLAEFVKSNHRNRRTNKNGKTLASGTKGNYEEFLKTMTRFSSDTGFELRFRAFGNNKRHFDQEKRYHRRLYNSLCDFLFYDQDHFDNYVGQTVKRLRTFYNWVRTERGLQIGEFQKSFHVWKEDIPILVLQPNQLRFLIFDQEFDQKLSPSLRRTKDLFVFGCTVALRASDLLSLQKENIEQQGTTKYLKVWSKKTSNFTKIKLPDYLDPILNRNKSRGKKLFRTTSYRNFNHNIKLLAEEAGWTNDLPKMRTKRGVPHVIYKNPKTKTHYRFCDLLSTHTMRRTAITTMLNLGVDESTTRKISGHAPGSVEFFKYVKYNQNNIDQQTDKMFQKLSQNVPAFS